MHHSLLLLLFLFVSRVAHSSSFGISTPFRKVQSAMASSSSGGSINDNSQTQAAVWCPDQKIYLGGIVPGATNEDVQSMIADNDGYLRVFGYGSLCWNPGNPQDSALGHSSVTSQSGYAKDYRRCWAQKSTDHRGTSVFPGIVCTLLQQKEVDAILSADKTATNERSNRHSRTEGMIYVVPPELVETCLEELDFREKGGYAREIITVVEDRNSNDSNDQPKEVQALLYRGTPDNPAFWSRLLWDLPLAAAVMAVSVGPSGPNDVYLNQLNEFLLQHQEQIKANNHQDHITTTTDNNDDTCTLATMTKALQEQRLSLYFLHGSGSNQHGQIRMLENGGTRSIHDTEDFPRLTETVVCCQNPEGRGVRSSKTDRPKAIFAGGGHSGLLTECGQLILWGWNENGQCGYSLNETTAPDTSPLPISKSLSNIRVESAALGFTHTLIIENSTGRLYAFGDDSHGQVTGQVSGTKTQQFTPHAPEFVREDKFKAVSSGLFHSAAITTEGELITFGSNKHGQALSNQNENASTTSGRWMPPDGSKCVDVVCGRYHTAVIDDRGRVWTFGDNKHGQLGRKIKRDDKTNENEFKSSKGLSYDPIPNLVDGVLGKEHDGQYCCKELKSGWSHLVGVATSKASTGTQSTYIYGWGRSDKGQLACKEKVVPIPRRLSGLEAKEPRKIACGSESTSFLVTEKKKDSLYSCGWNEHGNLGLPSGEEDVFDLTLVFEDVNKLASFPTSYTSDKPGTEGRSFLMSAGGGHFLGMLV